MLRLIGDVHGKWQKYREIVPVWESLQLGDLDFFYEWTKHIDTEKHKFIPGNHDRYNDCLELPNCLGNYGHSNHGNVSFFFVRGADSIDRVYRTEGKNWWPEEELTVLEGNNAIDEYEKNPTNVVFSHDCPQTVAREVFRIKDSSRTRQILETIYNIHQPELWVFGHHHSSVDIKIGKTRFVCLAELEYLDIE